MKKILALLLALTMVFALVACGPKADTPDPGKTDVPGVSEQPGNTDAPAPVREEIVVATRTATALTPWGTNNGTPGNYEVYEMLYECDSKGNMYPLLADARVEGNILPGCNNVPGSGVYTVKIYDYIKDHKGNAITAEDIAFCYNYQRENAETKGWNDLQKVEALDATTVQFTFAKDQTNVGQLLNILCRQFIVDEQEFKADQGGFTTTMCGTGPYKFVKYESGSALYLERNEDYWQTNAELRRPEQQANLKKITYKFIDETSQQVIALKTGTVDLVSGMADLDAAKAFADGGEFADKFSVYQYQQKFVNYLNPNCSEQSIMSDINMRLAVFNAIDRQGLVTALGENFSPLYAYANNYYGDYEWVDFEGMDNYNTRKSVDPAVVKSYLDKAGYKGEKIVLIAQDSDPATIIAGMLQAQNINCEAKILDRTSMQQTQGDPAAWDLEMGMMAGDANVTVWQHGLDWGKTNMTSNFIADKEWKGLLDKCQTQEGHNAENMKAWWEYAVENAYTMGLYAAKTNVIIPQDMVTLVMGDKEGILAGASIYGG